MIKDFIHWRYVLPRLGIAVVVLLAVWLGTEPVLHRFLTVMGERIIRAKIDIDDVSVSLANADMKLTGVEVANPRSLDRNLIECDTISLDVMPRSMLQRRLRVREASMTGVRFNRPRNKSGKADLPHVSLDVEDLDVDVRSLSNGALRQFARVISQDLQDDLLSIQLSQELSARWPEELQQLEAKVAAYVAEIQQLTRAMESGSQNPIGAATAFPGKVEEVERLRREYWKLKGELDRIVEQVERDRQAIAIAKRHDEQVIQRKLALRELDPQHLSEYLLGDELCDETKRMLRWIKLARRYWPKDLEMPPADRQSGEDIAFPGLRPLPKALVDRLRMEGTVEDEHGPVTWSGEIFNLTTDPAIVGQPMVIRAQVKGAHPMLIEATLDRTTNVARDRVVLSLPTIGQPARTLGNPEQLAVTLAPGVMRLWAELNLEGETLTGRVLVEQKEIQLAARLPAQYGERIAQRVHDATRHVDTLHAEIRLAGTLDKPSWQLQSNLGPQLATGLTTALRAELEARQHELVATLDQYLTGEQAKLDQRLAAQQEKVLGQLGIAMTEVDDLKRLVAGRLKVPGIGKLDDLPFQNPFYRR